MIKQLLKNRMSELVALLVLMVMVMSPAKALAYYFEVDGIYYNKISDTEVEVTENKGGTYYSGHIIIPESVVYNGITFSVTMIGDYAFRFCRSLTFISISESVTTIGDGAFSYCSSLTSISIPESVTMIGGCAFSGCSSLTSISIPNSVTMIGDYAFDGCSSLKEIIVEQDNIGYKSYNGVVYNSDLTKLLIVPEGLEGKFVIPESVTTIGGSAFEGCSSLTFISIPESVTTIGGSAFEGCSSLTSISIPESVTTIGGSAFRECSTLSSISIPNSVTSIGNYAFWDCSSLSSISIPNSVTSIGDYAFWDCSSLSSISIPNSVTSIGGSAFRGCSFLSSISIPNSVTSIGDGAFLGCSSLIFISIPESVTTIGDWAFNSCSSLSSISIPNSVTSIGDYAFGGCSSLTSISIPESVISIGDWAFDGCRLLKSVGCLAIVPPSIGIWWGVWSEDYTQVDILYVPAESVDAYKNSDWGRYFPKIVELSGITLDIKGDGKVYADDYDVISSDTKFYDRNYKFLFVPDAGNRIASITVDGEDVSANLNEHNVWTLKDYNGYGTLKVVFAPEAETSLTVKGMESHSLIRYYKEGERGKIGIVPEDGWQLYSLRFNGEDVTSEVVGNTYITPALSGSNNLEVVMQKGGNDGVDSAWDSARMISFRRNGSGVEILNLDEDENISIYNAAGVLQYQGTNHKVTLSPNEVYILRTHRETLKFAF